MSSAELLAAIANLPESILREMAEQPIGTHYYAYYRELWIETGDLGYLTKMIEAVTLSRALAS